MNPQEEIILEVNNMATTFETDHGPLRAVDDVSFRVRKGETLGIVGESGCGKTVTSLSIMRLLPQPAGKVAEGEILYRGKDILKMSKEELYHLRGNEIAMIFQEPMRALNPVERVGKQIAEVYKLHHKDKSAAQRQQAAIEMLKSVGVPSPDKRIYEFPHQMSGGMRQRVMIAIALACKPEILIADEPTTALDVTIQAQILDLIKTLQKENDTAVVFVTHDLGVIAEVCDSVLVMYAGQVVERGLVDEIFVRPKHPYTKSLLQSIPRLDTPSKSNLKTIPGQVPGLADMPKGCRFANRCYMVQDKCRSELPKLEQINDKQRVRCHFWKDV